MTDPRFADLRSSIERETLVPEFRDVSRRARRYQRRRRIATMFGALGATVVLLPGLTYVGVVLAQASDRPGLVQITVANGGNPNSNTTTVVVPSPNQRVTARLVAVGGVDIAHAYGLVDACRAHSCDLQLISLDGSPSTERIGLLRADPAESMADPRVVALGQTDVMVSAEVGDSIGPQFQTFELGPIFDAPRATRVSTTVVPVQKTAYGAISAVRRSDATVHAIARQPDLRSPVLSGTTGGWWVTGNDPLTGELSVAVSRDQGATWRSTPLGVPSDDTPSIATADGRKVYVLVRSGGQMLLIRSTNGGATWQRPTVENGWNSTGQYGVLAPADGIVAVWLADPSGAVSYRRSDDSGATFTPVTGSGAVPSGRVVALPGGYVSLGLRPQMSTDGTAWRTVNLPFVSPN